MLFRVYIGCMTIYTLTNTINGKQYVGKTRETAQKRFRQHVRDAKKGSTTAIHRAIRKYGEDVFIVSQIDTADTKDELNLKERRWISELKTLGEGYNMTPGGEGVGHKHSEATKAKQRKARTRYFKNNPEAKLQAAEWGKQAKLSDEGRERKRERMKGNSFAVGMTYQHTEQAKLAISRAHTGKIVSKETRDKIAAVRNREILNRNEAGQFTSGSRKP